MIFPSLQKNPSYIYVLSTTRSFDALPKLRLVFSLNSFALHNEFIAGSAKQNLISAKLTREKAGSNFVPMIKAEMGAGTRQGFVVPDVQLLADGMGNLLAGTDTTGATLSCGAWAVFSDDDVYAKLQSRKSFRDNYLSFSGHLVGCQTPKL